MKKKLEREKSLNFLKLHRIQTKEDLYNCLINEKILNKPELFTEQKNHY